MIINVRKNPANFSQFWSSEKEVKFTVFHHRRYINLNLKEDEIAIMSQFITILFFCILGWMHGQRQVFISREANKSTSINMFSSEQAHLRVESFRPRFHDFVIFCYSVANSVLRLKRLRFKAYASKKDRRINQ